MITDAAAAAEIPSDVSGLVGQVRYDTVRSSLAELEQVAAEVGSALDATEIRVEWDALHVERNRVVVEVVDDEDVAPMVDGVPPSEDASE